MSGFWNLVSNGLVLAIFLYWKKLEVEASSANVMTDNRSVGLTHLLWLLFVLRSWDRTSEDRVPLGACSGRKP